MVCFTGVGEPVTNSSDRKRSHGTDRSVPYNAWVVFVLQRPQAVARDGQVRPLQWLGGLRSPAIASGRTGRTGPSPTMAGRVSLVWVSQSPIAATLRSPCIRSASSRPYRHWCFSLMRVSQSASNRSPPYSCHVAQDQYAVYMGQYTLHLV